MSAAGTVTVRFDVQGNEKLLQALITTATGAEKTNTAMVKLQSSLGGMGVGNLGPLNNIATSVKSMETGMGTATTKIGTFKEKLAGIGTQLGQNATSFGVATASIWGVYNAYDSLEKVQIRAHASALRVQTLETTLASLTERRRIAVEKGNLTSEQMAVLNGRIADTQEKVSVAQERAADIAGDLKEAWAGFFSTVGPQAIAASGSIIQLGTTFKSTFSGGGGFINTFKNAITGLFPSLAAAKAESLLLGRNIGNLGSSVTGLSSPLASAKTATSGLVTNMAGLGGAATAATGTFGKLKMALGDVGSFLTSSKGLLLGMAGALGIAAAAAVSLFHVLSEGAKAKAFNENIIAGTASLKDLHEQIQTLQGLSADPFVQLEKWFFGGSLGKMIKPETTAGMSEELIKGIQAQIDVKEVGKTIKGMFDSMQPQLIDIPVDFKLMTPERQTEIQTQMKQIIAIINNPTNWKAKLDPATGKEIFSQADVQHFTINALEPLIAGLQTTVQSGALDAYIKKATDGVQKRIFDVMSGSMLTGETSKAAMASVSKTFGLTGLEPGSATEAAYKKAVAGIKARTAAIIEYIPRELEAAHTLGASADQTREYTLENFKLIKTFGGLTKSTLDNTEVRNKLKEVQDKQVNGFKEEELNLLDVAAANDVYSATIANLVSNQEDNVTQINNLIAGGINYTSGLTNMAKNQKLVSEGTRDGIIQAKGFYDSLVKTSAQEAVFQSAVADGANTLGIHADMLAFSSGKMQELIGSTYKQTLAFDDMKNAAVQSTAWLGDSVIQQTLLNSGMQKGAESANDWTASMIESVAANKSNHEQLLQLAADMLQIPINASLSSEQLQTLMTRFKETGDAAGSMASVMRDQLVPIFEPLKSFLTATNWDDFKSAFKDLDLKKLGIPKDLRASLKDAGEDLLHVNQNALEAKTGLSALFTVAFTGRSKGIKSGIKELLDDLKEIPTIGDLGPFTSQLEKIMDLPKEERAAAFKKMGPAIAEMMKALAPDEMGFVIITPEEIAKINAALGETGPSAQGSVSGINSLSTSVSGLAKSLLDVAEANFDASKFVPVGTPTGPPGKGKGTFKDPSLTQKTPAITPPPPVVFPPPDLSNILAGVSKAEIMMSEMVKYAAGLSIIFPEPAIDSIITGVSQAQIASGDLVSYIAGLSMAFPEPNIDAVITGVSEAQIAIGDVQGYIAGLLLVFQKPNTQPVTAGTSVANATIKTVETLIKGMKLPFQKPNIDAIISAVGAARKSVATVQTAVNSLKLKFPKIDISNIVSSVNSAQSKINSLKGKNVTNTITTHYETTGTKPGKAKGGVEYRETATNTTWGEGGPEVAVFMPLTRAGQPRKGDYDITIPSPQLDTTGIRNMLRNNRGDIPAIRSGGGGGPTTVNVTTEVYLFPGSDMFKKFVKSIMLEEMSRYATA